MQFLPLAYHTFLDDPTDYDRVSYDGDSTERLHRRALRQQRRRHR